MAKAGDLGGAAPGLRFFWEKNRGDASVLREEKGGGKKFTGSGLQIAFSK